MSRPGGIGDTLLAALFLLLFRAPGGFGGLLSFASQTHALIAWDAELFNFQFLPANLRSEVFLPADLRPGVCFACFLLAIPFGGAGVCANTMRRGPVPPGVSRKPLFFCRVSCGVQHQPFQWR